ncbi:unnamed protein product [Wuchereria bancrofti]|uniref:Uncharacterized protein n=1 Tax=Wuchereria bancrofti TaxID=6293 RepID=A0A3P7E6K7_WUCBA|nr:unnamed protein product [Wuchereria bancrofti]
MFGSVSCQSQSKCGPERTVSSENSQGNHHSGTSGRKLASQPLDRQGSTVQRTRPSQIEAGEMAHRFRALTALLKILSSNPSNHMVGGSQPPTMRSGALV